MTVPPQTGSVKATTCYGSIKEWCIAWWHSGRDYDEHYGYEADEHSEYGYGITTDTSLPSSVSR